ncbi:MAG: porin [Ottowia sp.]|nr:porin [Ottowia sp.]
MKKTLIALTVLGACGLAAAQSSVTVYGTADAGIGRVISPVLDPNNPFALGQATNANGCLQWDDAIRFIGGNSMMNNGPSILGLKGVEDVGGGNNIGFQFETGLSLEDGSAYEGDEYGFGGFWGRHANVYMAGDWGTVKLGRQPTVTHLTESVYDLTNLANYSVVRNTFRASGFPSRANSAIAYISPSMGGLTAAVAFASRNNDPYANNVWDLGVMYAGGPLAIGASVNNGLDNGKKNYHIGAKYSFGNNFALAASYHSGSTDGLRRVDRPWPVAPDLIRRGYSLGAQARFGAFTVTLDVTRDTRNEWWSDRVWSDAGTGGWDWKRKKYTNAVLEGKYSLSKRSFLYGAALRLDGYTHWGLGINHSF